MLWQMTFHYFNLLIMFSYENYIISISWAVGVPVGRCAGDQLATTLVATKNVPRFPLVFSPPSQPFLSARIIKLILQKLTGAPKNLGEDTFPDPVGHFGAPKWSFLILQAVRRWTSALGAARLVYIQNTHSWAHECSWALNGHLEALKVIVPWWHERSWNISCLVLSCLTHS